MKAALTPTLKERGIQKPSNKRQKAAKLNGAHAAKPNGAAPHASSKPLIGEWLELVNFAKTVTSPTFADVTMSHLKLMVAKIEPPPAKGSPSDVAIDEFAKSLAAMMIRVLTEVLTEPEDVVRKRVMSGTVLQALGPRPEGQPRSKASAYPVSPPQRGDEKKPLTEKHVYEMVDEDEFQKWLVERQARESVST